jgi:hypothetical protein
MVNGEVSSKASIKVEKEREFGDLKVRDREGVRGGPSQQST